MMSRNLQNSREKIVRVVLPPELLSFTDRIHPRYRIGNIRLCRDILRTLQQHCPRRRREVLHSRIVPRRLPAQPPRPLLLNPDPPLIRLLILTPLPHRRHPRLDHIKRKVHTMRNPRAHLLFRRDPEDRLGRDDAACSCARGYHERVYTVYHDDAEDLD